MKTYILMIVMLIVILFYEDSDSSIANINRLKAAGYEDNFN